MLLLLVLHLLWNALNNAPSNRAPSSLSRSAYSTIGNDSFSTVSHSHSLSRYYCCRAVYSASFAFAGTRTQDLFSHLYVCRGAGGEGEREHGRGARGYVNFSVKIHFVIMDFPCRIHRCQRRRLCHDTTTSATSPLPGLQPSRSTATITSIPCLRAPLPYVFGA